MPIALDSHYTIGKLHWLCQDYVLQGRKPFPWLILADGCSAVPDSDVGARLLALNARRLLPRFARTAEDEKERNARHRQLGRGIARRAARQASELSLDPTALDATLLVAWCDGARVWVHLYGDGCIAVRRADGGVAAILVEYAENAPYYLSYLLDTGRCALYREMIGDPATAQSIHYLNETGVTTRLEPFDSPTVFDLSLDALQAVVVATDGLYSFVSADTGERLDPLLVARDLLDFPDVQGDFVRRRLRQLLVDYGQQRAFNVDDIGLGAFVARS